MLAMGKLQHYNFGATLQSMQRPHHHRLDVCVCLLYIWFTYAKELSQNIQDRREWWDVLIHCRTHHTGHTTNGSLRLKRLMFACFECDILLKSCTFPSCTGMASFTIIQRHSERQKNSPHRYLSFHGEQTLKPQSTHRTYWGDRTNNVPQIMEVSSSQMFPPARSCAPISMFYKNNHSNTWFLVHLPPLGFVVCMGV